MERLEPTAALPPWSKLVEDLKPPTPTSATATNRRVGSETHREERSGMKHAIDPTVTQRSGADSSEAPLLCQGRFRPLPAGWPDGRAARARSASASPSVPVAGPGDTQGRGSPGRLDSLAPLLSASGQAIREDCDDCGATTGGGPATATIRIVQRSSADWRGRSRGRRSRR